MFKNITIIGMGSMGKALANQIIQKKIDCQLTVWDNNPQTVYAYAPQYRADTFNAAVKNADLIVLASPIHTYIPLAQHIIKSKKSPCAVMDIGSVKSSFYNELKSSFNKNGFTYVSAHPMFGGDAFVKQISQPLKTALIQDNNTPLSEFAAFWQSLDTHPFLIGLDEHDRAASLISHVPHLIAALYLSTNDFSDQNITNMAGTGFDKFFNFGNINIDLWNGIFAANTDKILTDLKNFKQNLSQSIERLEHGNPQIITRHFLSQQIQHQRES